MKARIIQDFLAGSKAHNRRTDARPRSRNTLLRTPAQATRLGIQTGYIRQRYQDADQCSALQLQGRGEAPRAMAVRPRPCLRKRPAVERSGCNGAVWLLFGPQNSCRAP